MLSKRTSSTVALFAFIVLLVSAGGSQAQKKRIQDKTNMPPSYVLMCLSAHPDDEDGATLAYYGVLENVKTYSIFYTRGEGGQNETGSELYDELGAIRTQETRNAAKVLGSVNPWQTPQIYFLGFPDFGFSKTAKETFAMWGGEDNVLAKIVYIIRTVKPDVIITNHDTVTTLPNRQHGNHQAVGITAYEAFAKAADPKYHPEQLRNGVTVWQTHKLFFRNFRAKFPLRDTTLSTEQHLEWNREVAADSTVAINVRAEISPSFTVEDLAWKALQQHRSQGMANRTLDSIPMTYRRHMYKVVRTDENYFLDNTDLFAGIKATKRNSFLPPGETDELPKFSVHVSPEYALNAPPQSMNASGGTFAQQFLLTLTNRTGTAFESTVAESFAGKQLAVQKVELTGKDSIEKVIDTVSLILPAAKSTKGGMIAVTVTAPHNLSAKATIALRPPDAVLSAGAKVGLIKTYDNSLEEFFTTYHVPFTLLDSTMLTSSTLAGFTTVVLDLRGYLYRPDAARANQALLSYANNGGNLVVFYHKTGDWNGQNFAPYPLLISQERVTEEKAVVTPLLPDHALLNFPNKILPADWNDWVQERSIYLPSGDTAKTSSKYQRLLAMSDEDEHQPSTSLLWASYGKGTYSFISLALYRQLRILNPAAVKLMLNLISQHGS
jgi:LmbE family N-acetylglucosaminyl deacetylase